MTSMRRGSRHRALMARHARALARRFATPGSTTPELDARVLVGHALGLDHAALAAQADRCSRRRSRCDRRARGAPARPRAGRAHRRREGVLGPAASRQSADAGAAAGDRDRGGGRARRDRRGGRAHAPLRIADLGTGSGALLLALLSRTAECARRRDRHQHRRRSRCARDNAERLGLAGRAQFVACDFGAALRGVFDLVVSQSALYRERRHRGACARGARPRSASRARRRRRRTCGLSRDRRRGARGCWRRRPPRGRDRRRPAATPCRSVRAPRACAVAPPRHDLAGVARALVARRPAALGHYRMAWHSSSTQKSTWNMARDRLGLRHGIDPRLRRHEARSKAPRGHGADRADEEADEPATRDRHLGIEMLHRFGRARYDTTRRAHDEGWATPRGRLRARGCCFETRDPDRAA